MIDKSKRETGILLWLIFILFVANTIILAHTFNKYKTLALVEADIIKSYHDFNNPDIYKYAQDYLEYIGKDTTELEEYKCLYK